MVFEHFALNVAEPTSLANWYMTHLGMQVVMK
ncbi:VOC family protein, partial [candidate division KSB3 bacterium]|nr:VOC family protein [candidate division KSB3 bacterium]MBD3323513.1 VOC family protein [candidate division KSB3 bacterium]